MAVSYLSPHYFLRVIFIDFCEGSESFKVRDTVLDPFLWFIYREEYGVNAYLL